MGKINLNPTVVALAKKADEKAGHDRKLIDRLVKSLSQTMADVYGDTFRFQFDESLQMVVIVPSVRRPAPINRSDLREAV